MSDVAAPFETADFVRRLRKAFKTGKAAYLGRPFRFFDQVGSTNDVARDWARAPAERAPEGAMVISAEQTAGRGRTGRPWLSAPGAGLWFSLVLEPGLGYPEAGMLPLAVGFGLALALRELGLPAAVKWPNDILLQGKKVGGVLVEGSTSGRRLDAAVAGVGVNWTLPEAKDLHYRVTGLAPELAARVSGPPPVPEKILVALLAGVEKAYLLLKIAGPAPFVSLWSSLSAHFGRPVLIYPDPSLDAAPPAPPLEGLGGGLLPDGSLEVIAAGRGIVRVQASDVSLGLPS